MLKKMLCSEVDNNIQRWPDFLPYLQQGYNVSIHDTTTCTPNRLMFGTENRLPVDTVFVEGFREELVPHSVLMNMLSVSEMHPRRLSPNLVIT